MEVRIYHKNTARVNWQIVHVVVYKGVVSLTLPFLQEDIGQNLEGNKVSTHSVYILNYSRVEID